MTEKFVLVKYFAYCRSCRRNDLLCVFGIDAFNSTAGGDDLVSVVSASKNVYDIMTFSMT